MEHNYTKANYPNLLTNTKHPLYYSFLKEIDKFCFCQSSHQRKDQLEKKQDFFNWSFKDKKIAFEKEDQCMAENFSSHAIHTFYVISIDTRIKHHLSLRLKHRLPSSSHFIASEESIQEKLSCLEEKIIKRCSKVKSLRTTYKCIENITNLHKSFKEIEAQCPEFQQEFNIAESKRLI
ncbi:hypothetical protein [Halobacteriovorax sp. HLS]|uniref:hypothetical protein n=1 Tax=Halobacteriovorax sp. HLS TaxID=2234000 RepID=UPI000FDC584D|nr:hypothetical protein [Halobacteriovorax sp. HLS]